MRRGRLICFIGVDGAGKTTVIEALGHGGNAVYKRCRFEGFVLLAPLVGLARVLLKLRGRKTDYSEQGIKDKEKLFASRLARKVYTTLVFVDYVLQIWCRLFVSLYVRKRLVYCDRYVYDTTVDLASEYGDENKTWLINITGAVARFLPRPDLVILLDVEPQVAYARALQKGDKTPLVFIARRRRLYRYLVGHLEGAVTVSEADLASTVAKVRHLIAK